MIRMIMEIRCVGDEKEAAEDIRSYLLHHKCDILHRMKESITLRVQAIPLVDVEVVLDRDKIF